MNILDAGTRRVAGTAAAIVFYAMVIVGVLHKRSPGIIAIRSFLGAMIAFLAAVIAMRMIIDILFRVWVANQPPPKPEDSELDDEDLDELEESSESQ